MSFFSASSIRSKLIAAFSLLSVLMVALGLFAIDRIKVMNGITNSITDNSIPSIRAVALLNTRVASYRISVLRHMLVVDEGKDEKTLLRLCHFSAARLTSDWDVACGRAKPVELCDGALQGRGQQPAVHAMADGFPRARAVRPGRSMASQGVWRSRRSGRAPSAGEFFSGATLGNLGLLRRLG